MNPKTIALTITTLFLVLILYLLGLRISVSYGEIKNIQEEEVEVERSVPAPTLTETNLNLSPSPSYHKMLEMDKIEEDGYLGPYGYISQNNINRREDFPHHNPLMYQEKEKDLLNNITE